MLLLAQQQQQQQQQQQHSLLDNVTCTLWIILLISHMQALLPAEFYFEFALENVVTAT